MIFRSYCSLSSCNLHTIAFWRVVMIVLHRHHDLGVAGVDSCIFIMYRKICYSRKDKYSKIYSGSGTAKYDLTETRAIYPLKSHMALTVNKGLVFFLFFLVVG